MSGLKYAPELKKDLERLCRYGAIVSVLLSVLLQYFGVWLHSTPILWCSNKCIRGGKASVVRICRIGKSINITIKKACMV